MKEGQDEIRVDPREDHLHRHADLSIRGIHPDQIGDQARALVELDQHDEVRIVKRRNRWMVGDDEAVDMPPTRSLQGIPFEGVAARTHRTRRVAQASATPAALNQESPLLHAGSYALSHRSQGLGFAEKSLVGLSFLGGGLLTGLFMAPFLFRRRVLAIAVVLTAACAILAPFLEELGPLVLRDEMSNSRHQLGGNVHQRVLGP